LEKVNVIGIVDFGGRAARLDGVATEIANLKATFGERVQDILSDRQASETAVRSLLARPGILSISTHGQKIPDRPLEAYLICQPDERHDGLLRAGELYSFDIQSDLVLLNACYGGFADRSPLPADDLFGVQRALLHSGARTVVSGLWDIYDATAPDIMNDFWRRVAAGHAAPRSLNEAQRGYLKTWREFPQEPLRLLTHPYYWAVFTVAGDDRTGQVLP
jgi:CHAT domain-containing protein